MNPPFEFHANECTNSPHAEGRRIVFDRLGVDFGGSWEGFGHLGRPQDVPKSPPRRPKGVPKMCPKSAWKTTLVAMGAQTPPSSDFGSFWDGFWKVLASILEGFGVDFGWYRGRWYKDFTKVIFVWRLLQF